MKWVILAWGTGSRLFPTTKWVNKHLLPVYDRPMIYYPIQTLVNAGVYEILIITSGDAIWPLSKQLGSGADFLRKDSDKQIQILYGIQNEPLGIAHALRLTRSFVGKESVAVVLGDNIIEDNISQEIADFTSWAKVFLKQVKDPERFWVAALEWDRIVSLVEKPKDSKSDLAVIGLYIYDNSVFEKIDRIQPSWRNELEITDVNQEYLKEGTLQYKEIHGHWMDTWTFDSLHETSQFFYNLKHKKW